MCPRRIKHRKLYILSVYIYMKRPFGIGKTQPSNLTSGKFYAFAHQRLFPCTISNTESLPQADYYSWDVCPSPLSVYFQHGRQQKYFILFWAKHFSDCDSIICPIKSKLRFLKVCKILKRTWHFQTDWILCDLNCSGCTHVVSDAGSTCSCC